MAGIPTTDPVALCHVDVRDREHPTVRCAHCNSMWTHQFVCVVHNRIGEDKPTKAKVVGNGALEWVDVPANPSERRQGASIGLTCEGCEGRTWVHVWQDRGRTFIQVVAA